MVNLGNIVNNTRGPPARLDVSYLAGLWLKGSPENDQQQMIPYQIRDQEAHLDVANCPAVFLSYF